ncbi:hypothetical protein VKT23_000267 [Stygiomarasmius scandens]|uniref:Uncharacterized protein n=1 Tax=Marasmiellus scandens TaxID=2682957 RepID=A0ABR1K706_9AGAR
MADNQSSSLVRRGRSESESSSEDPREYKADKVRLVPGPDRQLFDEVLSTSCQRIAFFTEFSFPQAMETHKQSREERQNMQAWIESLESQLRDVTGALDRANTEGNRLRVENKNHNDVIDWLATEASDKANALAELANLREHLESDLTKEIEEKNQQLGNLSQQIYKLQELQMRAEKFSSEQQTELIALRSRQDPGRNPGLQFLNTLRPSKSQKRSRQTDPIVASGPRVRPLSEEQDTASEPLQSTDEDVQMVDKTETEPLVANRLQLRQLILEILHSIPKSATQNTSAKKQTKSGNKTHNRNVIRKAFQSLTVQEEYMWRVVVRGVFKELQQVPNVTDFHNYPSATEKEVEIYEEEGKGGPGEGYQLYFGEIPRWRKCKWNLKVVANIASAIISAHDPLQTGLPALDENAIEAFVWILIEQGRESWSLSRRKVKPTGELETAAEAEKRVSEQKAKKQQDSLIRTRKLHKYDHRVEAIEETLRNLDPESNKANKWRQLQYLVKTLGKDGQSSDEDLNTYDRGGYDQALQSTMPHWRSRKIRKLLGEVDKAGDGLRILKKYRPARKTRVPGKRISTRSKAKLGLPMSFYDQKYLQSLRAGQLNDLQVAAQESDVDFHLFDDLSSSEEEE